MLISLCTQVNDKGKKLSISLIYEGYAKFHTLSFVCLIDSVI